MLLMLSPTAEQDVDLEALIKEEHTPGFEQYHHWRKPAGIGERFGVSQHERCSKGSFSAPLMRINW